VLWQTREQAISAPKADMRLGFCRNCGHIYNCAFDPDKVDYTQNYENSLHFSPRFQKYARSLAARLIERHNLYDKDIIEIGCGRGDFLKLLCETGGNRGLGFDPSHPVNGLASPKTGSITFIPDFYSEDYADYKADLICCRHVLEHIQFPRDFLANLRRAIGSRLHTVVFFEVPNAVFTLKDLSIWDLIYEHCSYFSIPSLNHVFTASGFEVSNLTEGFEAQFLCIEALPVDNSASSIRDRSSEMVPPAEYVAVFTHKYQTKVNTWRDELKRLRKSKQSAVVWGAGSKGVTFLNTLKIHNHIQYVVDINPHKQGKYVPGTAQKIVPPDFLLEYKPDKIILVNPIYTHEILDTLKRMNITADLLNA